MIYYIFRIRKIRHKEDIIILVWKIYFFVIKICVLKRIVTLIVTRKE